MEFEVVWTEPALADFESVVRYVAARNPTAAETLRAAVLDHVELLAKFPFVGPAYDRDQSGRAGNRLRLVPHLLPG
jgi:plasmid stabilization system protein ParE